MMLFRLQMLIDAAIDADLFFQEGTFKATRPEEAMLTIINRANAAISTSPPSKRRRAKMVYLFTLHLYSLFDGTTVLSLQ